MRPGACAPLAGAHDHAPVRVRLLHTSAVNAVTVALVVVAAGRSGTVGSGAAGAGVGDATLSGADEGVAAAVAGEGSVWGARGGSAGAGDGAGAAALGDVGGTDAARSRDEFELIKYQPTTASITNNASTAAIAGTRDGSRMAAGALSVFGVTGTADDERSGKSSSDGGAVGAERGDGGAAAFFGAAGGAFGCGGGGGAGRGGGTDDADGAGGADEAAGPNADNALGAGEAATGDVSFDSFADASFKGMPRAEQNCSRFSRLVVTNGSFAGKLEVAMAYARR
jgi:hypothetical protein